MLVGRLLRPALSSTDQRQERVRGRGERKHERNGPFVDWPIRVNARRSHYVAHATNIDLGFRPPGSQETNPIRHRASQENMRPMRGLGPGGAWQEDAPVEQEPFCIKPTVEVY